MGDFDELKKKIDTFTKEVKAFSSGIAGTSSEIEDNQNKYVELRNQQKAFIKEVNEFQPAKKVFFLEKKKSGLLKTLQEELTKSSMMMEKHNIPVPPEQEEEHQQTQAADAPAAEAAAEATPPEAKPEEAAAAAAAAAAAPPVPTPRQEISAAPTEKPNEDGRGVEGDEEDSEEFEEEDDEEEEEEEEVQKAAPTPAPRQQAAPKPAAEATDEQVEKRAVEEEEEDDDDDDDDMRSLASDEPNLFEVLHAYKGQEADMLTIVPGEQLLVLRVGADGWWLARNSRGHEGIVPSNLLKEVEESETGDEAEDAEYEEDDDDDDEVPTAVGLAPPAAEQPERMMSQNSQLLTGLPSGFRTSTLAKWFYEGTDRYPGCQFRLAAGLKPKLAPSCVAMQDGWCGSGTGAAQIKPLPSRVEKLLQLQKCSFMPTELSVPVLDRFVRLCLFDGKGPVSNVITVRAVVANKNDDRVWNFASRLGDSTPGLEFGELYLRYNYAPNHVCLLVEATIVCTEAEPQGQQPTGFEKLTELSIGHVTIPLCDENGGPLPAKSLDLQLEGGTPFEQQVEVDSSLSKPGDTPRRASLWNTLESSFSASQSTGGLFRGSSANSKQPRIQLKFSMPNREVKEFMDTCPGTIIGSMAHLQLHSLYRHVLGQELSNDSRIVERDCAPVYGPSLAQFTAMVDQPDMMDLIRRRWNEFAKRDRTFRKPLATEAMKQEFNRIVKSVYLLNQVKDFQPYVFGNKAQEQARANLIQDFQRRTATDPTGTNFSLCAEFVYEPFNMEEVTVPLLGQHSVPVIPVAVE